MTTNGINGASGNRYSLDTAIGPLSEPPIASGSPEELIAQVAVRLEEAGARDSDVARQMRRSQTRANRAALDDKRKAAALQLAAGLTNATASAVQGAISFGQASQDLQATNHTTDANLADSNGSAHRAGVSRRSAARHEAQSKRLEGGGKLAEAAGQGAGSIMSYFGERASIEAEEHEQEAQILGDSADAADEARESAQRFSDKAMQHLAEMAEARHRSVMAAIPG